MSWAMRFIGSSGAAGGPDWLTGCSCTVPGLRELSALTEGETRALTCRGDTILLILLGYVLCLWRGRHAKVLHALQAIATPADDSRVEKCNEDRKKSGSRLADAEKEQENQEREERREKRESCWGSEVNA